MNDSFGDDSEIGGGMSYPENGAPPAASAGGAMLLDSRGFPTVSYTHLTRPTNSSWYVPVVTLLFLYTI